MSEQLFSAKCTKFSHNIMKNNDFETEVITVAIAGVITLISCAEEAYSDVENTNGTINGRLVVIAVRV